MGEKTFDTFSGLIFFKAFNISADVSGILWPKLSRLVALLMSLLSNKITQVSISLGKCKP